MARNFFFGASKKLVTGPNVIIVAQTFCDILFMKKRHQISIYNSFHINCFLSITLTLIQAFISLTRVGGGALFKVILVGTGVQLKLRKHPNAYIAIK
jgi:hypothetical protein